jgi:hypothetical protein
MGIPDGLAGHWPGPSRGCQSMKPGVTEPPLGQVSEVTVTGAESQVSSTEQSRAACQATGTRSLGASENSSSFSSSLTVHTRLVALVQLKDQPLKSNVVHSHAQQRQPSSDQCLPRAYLQVGSGGNRKVDASSSNGTVDLRH